MANLYVHSGKNGMTGIYAPLFGSVLAVIGALIYAYAVVYIPIVGIVSIALLGGYTALVGLGTGRIAKFSKCRNPTFLSLVTAFVALIGLYSSWVFFLFALYGKVEDLGLSALFYLFVNPVEVWSMITELNQTGWFTIKGATPSGIVLWIFWILEALILVVGSVILAPTIIAREVFCEQCNGWAKFQSSTKLQIPEEWISKLPESVDHTAMSAFAEADPNAPHYILAELLQCPLCEHKAIRYTRVITQVDDKGKSDLVNTEIPGIILIA